MGLSADMHPGHTLPRVSFPSKDIMFKSLIIVATLALAGCAAVPMAEQAADQRAKTFTVAPGKANIYVYRNELLGAAIKMNVALDGKLVGSTGARTYLVLEVEPGRHALTSMAENDEAINLDVAAGTNTFVWQEVKMGLLSARSRLHRVDDAKGRAEVADCQLIATAAPDAPTVPQAASPAPAVAAEAAPTPVPPPGVTAPTPTGAQAVAGTPAKQPMAAPATAAPRGTFEFEAERAAMAAGCKRADGVRPAATLVSKQANVEIYDLSCAMKVQCESGMCKMIR